ncbi:Ycf48-like protein [Pandoraea captiosa]|uniref:Ycf48-like protein n=1 Tax=Pandoraea captiosa TaxID=2508302 RepID=A0A5E5A966_9BURK|nr:YCF48-related protein [Pandoraea captiosa]VVE70159.1 Ycf48-like protein [Pandoraea captiosa]
MHKLVGIAMSAIVAVASVVAFSARPEPAFPPTQIKSDKLLVSGIDVNASGAAAAGDIGTMLVSTDQGRTWHPAQTSPGGKSAESALTRLHFVDASHGFSVGQDQSILKTEDGGKSWTRVHVASDRPEPLFDLYASAGGPLFAVGAFGAFLESTDAGRTWNAREIGVEDAHLYGIAGRGDKLLIAGEQGLVARSVDGGRHWTTVPKFYGGSFFGALALSQGKWLVYGMRGRVYISDPDMVSWQEIPTHLNAALYGGTQLRDGRVVLVGQGGAIALSDPGVQSFVTLHTGARGSYSDVREMQDGSLLLAGETGIAVDKAILNAKQP